MNDRHMSGQIDSWTASYEQGLSDTTVVLSGGTQFIPGLLNGSLSISGFFDPETGSLYHELRQSRNQLNPLVTTVAPEGLTEGSTAFLTIGNKSEMSVDSNVQDAVTLTTSVQPDQGADWGVLLHAHAEETTTADGTAFDNGAGTSNGAVASLHVTSASGTTPTLDVLIEHSPDDGVYSTLGTFQQLTDVGHEFLRISGDVDQFVRATWTIGGTDPAFTFAVAFARR